MLYDILVFYPHHVRDKKMINILLFNNYLLKFISPFQFSLLDCKNFVANIMINFVHNEHYD